MILLRAMRFGGPALLLAVLLVAALPQVAQASGPAFVNHTSSSTQTPGTSITASYTATTGNAIFIGLVVTGNTPSLIGCSDAHNTYTNEVANNFVSTAAGGSIWFNGNVTGGSLSIKCSWTNSESDAAIYIAEFSGCPTIDQHPTGASGTGTTATSSNMTTTAAAECMFGLVHTAGTPTISAGGSWTLLDQVGKAPYSADEYEITSATGTYTTNFTWTGSEAWGSEGATSKPSAAAAPLCAISLLGAGPCFVDAPDDRCRRARKPKFPWRDEP